MRLLLLDGLSNNGEFAADADVVDLMTEILQSADDIVLGFAQFCVTPVELLARPVGNKALIGEQDNAERSGCHRRHSETFGKPSCKTPAVCSVNKTSNFSMVTSGGSMTRSPRLCARAIICRSS